MTSKLKYKRTHKLTYKPPVGGFTDLASFRAETGLTPAEMSDADAQNVIYMDAKYHVENLEKENAKLRAVQPAVPAVTPAIKQDYDPFYTARVLNDIYRPLNINSVLETERLRQKIRNELDQERVLKLLLNSTTRHKVQPRTQPRAQPRAQSRAQPRAQSRHRAQSKTRSRSKPRAKSKSKHRK